MMPEVVETKRVAKIDNSLIYVLAMSGIKQSPSDASVSILYRPPEGQMKNPEWQRKTSAHQSSYMPASPSWAGVVAPSSQPAMAAQSQTQCCTRESNTLPMLRAPLQRLQNQHVERALQQFHAVAMSCFGIHGCR
jgi:hypothetical protein